MREYATPSSYRLPPAGNLTDDVVANAERHPSTVSFVVRDRQHDREEWRDVTAVEFLAQVTGVAKGLVASGVQAGDRVVLWSRTRYEWTLLDYALWFAGAVSVPVYDSAAAEQVAWILEDSQARFALVETTRHREVVQEALRGQHATGQVWCLDEGALGSLTARGVTVSDAELEARRTSVRPSSLATLVYTSGTTGRPKGCMLTHGNFMVELAVAVDALGDLFDQDSSSLLFLPLPHVLARVVQVGAVRTRTRLAHTAGIAHLPRDLADLRPTFVLAVPRVFEKVFTTASQRAVADGRGPLFDRSVEVAIAYSRALDGKGPGPLLRARHRFFDRLVYARLREQLGGRCRFAISGGAPLGERLGHFYRGAGVTVLEGYGLTESTAALTLNLPEDVKLGTVGRPLGGSAVRVSDDGELQVRGGQLFSGYWRDEDATAAVMTDGWLSTGDLGEIDDEGFVRVTGRRQELLVTLGGKNVAPTVLEDEVRSHPLVGQCLVVGDGRPFVAALVTLDPEAVHGWARAHDTSDDPARLADDPRLLAEVQTAVDTANAVVSQAESIRRFAVLPGEWTEEGGQLTPSLKLRRRVVLAQFREEIEALYAS